MGYSGKLTPLKPEPNDVPSRLSRFTDRLVTLAKRAVSGDPAPSVKKGDSGYADWVIIVIHGLREYLDLPYRQLLDVLHEMYDIVEKMGLDISELLHSGHGRGSVNSENSF